jgi:hypothetical protein
MRGAPPAHMTASLYPTLIAEPSMTNTDDSERLLTREELAAHWRASPKTVSRIPEKDLPVVRIGKLVRYRPKDVSAYEKRRRP